MNIKKLALLIITLSMILSGCTTNNESTVFDEEQIETSQIQEIKDEASNIEEIIETLVKNKWIMIARNGVLDFDLNAEANVQFLDNGYVVMHSIHKRTYSKYEVLDDELIQMTIDSDSDIFQYALNQINHNNYELELINGSDIITYNSANLSEEEISSRDLFKELNSFDYYPEFQYLESNGPFHLKIYFIEDYAQDSYLDLPSDKKIDYLNKIANLYINIMEQISSVYSRVELESELRVTAFVPGRTPEVDSSLQNNNFTESWDANKAAELSDEYAEDLRTYESPIVNDVTTDKSILIIDENVAENQVGNTNGNIVNYGLAAIDDNWIYYSSKSDNEKLYKMDYNNTTHIKINDDQVDHINVIGDRIYYRNKFDNYTIYSCKTDGTSRIKINNDPADNIIVIGNWIYYINKNDSFVYKVKVNGEEKACLSQEECVYIIIVDNYIYYANINSKGISRIDTDGNNYLKILDYESCSYLNVVDNWIFYLTYDGIECVSIDGNGKDTIYLNKCNFLNVEEDNLYFIYGIFGPPSKMSIYDIRAEQLDNEECAFINIVGDWIYYLNGSDVDYNYRMSKDGRNIEKF